MVTHEEFVKEIQAEIEQRVLDFCKTLDHPANSVEVRDKFNFKLRADARRIFRKLDKLGFGENHKEGRKYAFYVKGKEYPKIEEKKDGQKTKG